MAFTATISSASQTDTYVWTNFGPLTTAYHGPEICQVDPANVGLVEFTISTGNLTTTSFDCGQANNLLIQNAACFPSSAAVQHFATVPVSSIWGGYWSPGISCPSGWSTVATTVYPPVASASASNNVPHDMIGNKDMSATLMQCCPGGFTGVGWECAQQITTATSGAMCALNFACSSTSSGPTVCPSNATSFSWDSSSTGTTIMVSAYAMLLMYQGSDIVSTSVVTQITSNPVTSHSTGSTSSTAKPTGHGGGSSSDSAKVLVPAIVVPIVALAAFIGAVVYCLHRRKRKARTLAEGSYGAYSHNEKGFASNASDYNGNHLDGDRNEALPR